MRRLHLGQDSAGNLCLAHGLRALEVVNAWLPDSYAEVGAWPDEGGHLTARVSAVLGAMGCASVSKSGGDLSVRYINRDSIQLSDLAALVEIAVRQQAAPASKPKPSSVPEADVLTTAVPAAGEASCSAAASEAIGMRTVAPPATSEVAGVPAVASAPHKRRRPPLSAILKDGQRVRHTNKFGDAWVATYATSSRSLIHADKTYSSLSAFSGAHHAATEPDRTPSSNGWDECRVEKNGRWASVVDEWMA